MGTPPTSVNEMSDRKEEIQDVLPELLTEFMVDMKCDGCVSAVKKELQSLHGVKSVDADLANQVVRVFGSVSLKSLKDALEQTGRTARLIGQGSREDFLVSAAVGEFKGPLLHGVVWFAQVNLELTRIEARFSGLSPGMHGWSINEYGDLTKGAATTGKVFNISNGDITGEALGDLGTLNFNDKGEAYFLGTKKMLKVVDLIGRSVVVYETKDRSDAGIAAAVIARSAGVGENYKKICACDGAVIWESVDRFFYSQLMHAPNGFIYQSFSSLWMTSLYSMLCIPSFWMNIPSFFYALNSTNLAFHVLWKRFLVVFLLFRQCFSIACTKFWAGKWVHMRARADGV